ncbi:MAG: UDP-N-acetylglucosamine 1-carboxyvinyltransferase [Patescibacteria group bacterium]
MYYKIEGNKVLSGSIQTLGSKNAILKLIPASLLLSKPVTFTNVPKISDVEVELQILNALGVKYEWQEDENTPESDREITAKLYIDPTTLSSHIIPANLATKIRASVVFLGPLLAKFGMVETYVPGGDSIGTRGLHTHFEILSALGCEFEIEGNRIIGKVNKDRVTKLTNREIWLSEPSVTASENAIMFCAGIGLNQVRLFNLACEPHVNDLVDLFRKAGVSIDGFASNSLDFQGRETDLVVNEHFVVPDHIDAASNMVPSLMTGGEITLTRVYPYTMRPIFKALKNWNIQYEWKNYVDDYSLADIFIPAQELFVVDQQAAVDFAKCIYTQPWPAFPTDFMSQVMALATKVSGTTLFYEKMYEGRMLWSTQMLRFGASVFMADAHRVIITGKSDLRGATATCPDIRAGFALLCVALAAKGESKIYGIDHIYRAYPRIHQRLNLLGAQIEEVED